ncbi:rod shape-determining protein MreC [Motiliproteus coralliicola]|uniref:Cell shape-determining protein MreC n=1 Tax=Motiliproteus coralliicola TaxID=2283196 RepID=A0A369WDS4_9GAMM|nr:rod shape-determining protein MreC [Motiliproteus coralliicola]RDE19797.1 rod shape-determining protein MreC [Motiliproteus coralliicola]
MKPIFKGQSSRTRLSLIVVLSFSLMATDLLWSPMAYYRGYLTLAVTPLRWLMDVPTRMLTGLDQSLSDRDQLQLDNEKLRSDLLLMARKLQRLDSLTTENAHLRELLNSSERLDQRVLLAELIGVSADPFSNQLVINKGLNDQVYLGQPVLDENGVMGQVVEVGPYTSRVLLITDVQHAIPVQDNRSGFRSLLIGRGKGRELLLNHVPDTADIQAGDLLISSSLGSRFPFGYPVATVTEVIHDPGQAFATVRAEPAARLDTSRHLLLVFTPQQQPVPPVEEAVVPKPTASQAPSSTTPDPEAEVPAVSEEDS